VLAYGGYSLLKATIVPIVFLLFAIPLPYFVDSILTWRLQLISSQLGVFFITLFGIPVYLEGNVIDLGHYKLQVVEACSGLRYLFPLFSLGFLAAYLFQAPIWQRALVLLSTIPIAIVMNSLRIGMVGVMADLRGPQSADGLLHLFEGWIIFIACAALLAGEIYLLARISGRGFFESFHLPGDENASSAPVVTQRTRLPSIVGMLAVIGILVSGTLVSGRQEIAPERSRFVSFPSNLGEWRGRASAMQPQIEHALGLEDYILTDYRRSDGKEVNFYVAYYSSQRKGVSPHSPTVCIPGGGWLITQFDRTVFDDGSSRISLPTNRVVIEKDSAKRIVYYWFDQRGRKIANEWWSKWYLLVDAISLNRTDGALVRLTTAVYPGESERDAERRLQSLIPLLVPSLAGYVPGGPATQTTRALGGSTDKRS
jgi:exosortase D (VPLPA-CTERM-specific)